MEFIKEIKSSLLIMAGFYIVIGIIMLIAPIFVNNTICYLIGSICLIVGGLSIYTYIASAVYGPLAAITLIVGIVFVALGIFVILNPKTFSSLIPFIMGIVLVIDALGKMQSAGRLKKYEYKNWWQILVGALLVFAFGIILLINPFESLTLLIRILGIFLIIVGVSSAMTAFSYSKIEKSIK